MHSVLNVNGFENRPHSSSSKTVTNRAILESVLVFAGDEFDVLRAKTNFDDLEFQLKLRAV
jgi:hypothetical protein